MSTEEKGRIIWISAEERGRSDINTEKNKLHLEMRVYCLTNTVMKSDKNVILRMILMRKNKNYKIEWKLDSGGKYF